MHKTARDLCAAYVAKGKAGPIVVSPITGKLLTGLNATEPVYVIVHGAEFQSLLVANGKARTAEWVAKRIRDDSLALTHKDVHLFACCSALAISAEQPVLTVAEKKVAAKLAELGHSQLPAGASAR